MLLVVVYALNLSLSWFNQSVNPIIFRIYPTQSAISPTPTLYLAQFMTSSSEQTLVLSFSTCVFHVFGCPRLLLPCTPNSNTFRGGSSWKSSRGMPHQKMFEKQCLEMPFPAFWGWNSYFGGIWLLFIIRYYIVTQNDLVGKIWLWLEPCSCQPWSTPGFFSQNMPIIPPQHMPVPSHAICLCHLNHCFLQTTVSFYWRFIFSHSTWQTHCLNISCWLKVWGNTTENSTSSLE